MLAAAALCLGMVACSEKDGGTTDEPQNPGTSQDPDNPDTPDKPDTPTDPVTPPVEVLPAEESKRYLEDVAYELLGKFNPADQRAAVDAADYVYEHYHDLDFADGDDDFDYSPARVAAGLKRLLTRGDISGASDMYDEIYRFADFTGIYQAGEQYWERVGDSDDIIFRCRGAKGDVELRATASKDVWTGTHGDVTAYIPKTITVTFTEGSVTHAKAVVSTDVNEGAHTFALKADVTVANLNVIIDATGSDARLTEAATLKVDGAAVVSTTADVRGSNLCDFESYRGHISSNMVSSARGTVDLLGRVQLRAASTGDAIGMLRDADGHDEAEIRRICNTLNKSTAASVYYGSDVEQGKLVFTPKLEDYYPGYEYWCVGCDIEFAADGSRVDAGSYFERGFDGVIDRYLRLLDSYSNLW
ncbi:MAG: hypothetical protein NC406_05040 [Bacteroides sp.]|nr:hypothetical protein [Bacteroides sp.]MCM1095104.1 hypothetical protein [Terasakiella sp.]